MQGTSEGGMISRAWAAWCRFWFTPADPTPLCLMRIVAGLLVLYVHIAYSFDLHAFFGPDGWYPTALADRERREWPQVVPQSGWDRKPRFQMPETVEQRHALRIFFDNLANDSSKREKVIALLNWLPADPGQRFEVIQVLKDLPQDFADREAVLRDLVAAKSVDSDAERRFGRYLANLTTAQKQEFQERAHELSETVPRERPLRVQIYILLAQHGPQDIAEMARFIEKVADKFPDPAKRKEYLDYTEYWPIPPDHPEIVHIGKLVYSPFFHVTNRTAINVLHSIHLTIIVLFILGFCTRVTSVLTWLVGLAYIQRNPLILFGQDTMMNLCLFYLMFAPCGATWSIDWLIARYRKGKNAIQAGRLPAIEVAPQPSVSANFVIRLIQLQYCFMYMSAGMSKLKGPSWWNGTAPWYCVTNPEFSPLHIGPFYKLIVWLCQDENRIIWEVYMNVVDVFTLVLEIGLPFLVWTRLRPLMIFGAIMLHLGIALNMGLIVFSLFMFTLLLAWMPPAAIRRVFARPPKRLPALKVRYDGHDPQQLRAAAMVSAADVWRQVEWEERAHSRSISNGMDADRPLEVISHGESLAGADAAHRLARSLGMTQTFAWVLRLPGISSIAGAIFGGNRRSAVELATTGKP